jgi:hypothetical protein
MLRIYLLMFFLGRIAWKPKSVAGDPPAHDSPFTGTLLSPYSTSGHIAIDVNQIPQIFVTPIVRQRKAS